MAIDSENKRRAAVNFPLFTTAPKPDGTIDKADREQATGYYPGIPAGSPAASDVSSNRMLTLGVC